MTRLAGLLALLVHLLAVAPHVAWAAPRMTVPDTPVAGPAAAHGHHATPRHATPHHAMPAGMPCHDAQATAPVHADATRHAGKGAVPDGVPPAVSCCALACVMMVPVAPPGAPDLLLARADARPSPPRPASLSTAPEPPPPRA